MKSNRDPITSRDNEWFRRFRRAAERHDEELLLEGPKQIGDAVRAGWKPVAVARCADPRPGELLFSSALIAAVSDTRTSQGVIALFNRREMTAQQVFAKARTGPVVVLDGIQDPGNVGTIVRLAAAFDCAGVLTLPGTADPYSPKALRASTGTAIATSIARSTVQEVVSIAGDADLPLFVAEAGGRELELPRACVLVLGSEGQGPSPEWTGRATPVAVRIAQSVESLNVAAAAAILLHASYVSGSRS